MSSRNMLFASALVCLAVVVAFVPAGEVNAANVMVTNCNDSGSGSLRRSVAEAASGDTIDMSALPCREIDLTSGAIEITQHDLSLLGGPPGLMKVDAGHASSVLRHSGTGLLRIKRMNIANGSYSSSIESYGGCIYSAGRIELLVSNVYGCRVKGAYPEFAAGGGIYAVGPVRLVHSRVAANRAVYGFGGGIVTHAGVRINHSRVSGNRALFIGGVVSGAMTALYSTFANNDGGAIYAESGDLVIANSTFSGNTDKGNSTYSVIHWTADPGFGASIIDSTVSGNAAFEGEIVSLVGAGPKSIINTTIAFNQLSGSCNNASATVRVGGGTTLLDSTIASNNSCDGVPQSSVAGTDYPETSVLTGANNLVTAPAGLSLPPDTIFSDPLLAPLADNGGPTKTHMLPADSPAIDMGNNEAGLQYDQRGPGFPRVNGTSADIGAFER